MAQTTSDNIKPCNIGQSEAHNLRTQKYMDNIKKENVYIRTDLSCDNESWMSELMSQHTGLQSYYDMLKVMVKEKTKRKMQEKIRQVRNPKTGKLQEVNGSSPLRESCVIIKEDTTMDDVKEYARLCHERWGITAIEIFIHRDEGHWEDAENRRGWKPNLHAHIVWDWMDHETGKSFKLTPIDCSKIQDFAAEALGMARGVPKSQSGREHLERNDYILNKQKGEIEKLQMITDGLDAEIEKKTEAVTNLDSAAETRKSEIADLEHVAENHREEIEKLHGVAESKRGEIAELEQKRDAKKKAIDEENGSAVKEGLANLFGKGKYRQIAEENERVTQENAELKRANEWLKDQVDQIPVKVEELTKKRLIVKEDEHRKEIAQKQSKVNELLQKLQTLRQQYDNLETYSKNRIQKVEREKADLFKCIDEIMKLVSVALQKAVQAVVEFSRSILREFRESQFIEIMGFIRQYEKPKDAAELVKTFARPYLNDFQQGRMTRKLDELTDNFPSNEKTYLRITNQDQSQGRGFHM